MIEEVRQDLSLIASLVPHKSSALDIGCGTGALLSLLREARGVVGYGLEIDPQDVSRAVAAGLSVVQGDANTDMQDYPDGAFDTVILSNSLQALARPDLALVEATRIGRRVIVSFPNFGHWRVRAHILRHGTMPVSPALPMRWFETTNIHLCTVTDFLELANERKLKVEQAFRLTSGRRPRMFDPQSPGFANFWAEAALFVLSRR